jgi:hypothetical protein
MVTNFRQEKFWGHVYHAKPPQYDLPDLRGRQGPQRKTTMKDLLKKLGVFAPLQETLFGSGLSGLGVQFLNSEFPIPVYPG